MNKKFIDEYNILNKKWKLYDELDVEIDMLGDQLYQTLADTFIEDKILKGTWNASLSPYHIMFKPVKLENKSLLKEYIKFVQTYDYKHRLEFFISKDERILANIYLFENFKIQISLLHFDVECLNKFLYNYGITINRLEPVELGVNLEDIFAVQTRILQLTNKK